MIPIIPPTDAIYLSKNPEPDAGNVPSCQLVIKQTYLRTRRHKQPRFTTLFMIEEDAKLIEMK